MTAIRVELELDDGSFTTRMLRAGQSIASFEQQAGGAIRSINALQSTSQGFLATMRDVTVVLGQASAAISFARSITTGWASEIIKVNAEFERLRTLLSGMSKAADPMKDAAQQLKDLRDFAKTTPYSLQAITGVFTQMKASGIDPLKGSMKSLVDSVASFGGSEEVMKRASLAISQMSGKGVIQMEELRQQLGEAIPRATELMARSMGVTVPQLVKAISTGTVEARRGLELLSGELERTFGGAAQAQMNTWNGLMAQFNTGLQNLAEGVGGTDGAGFFESAKQGARDLIALMENPAVKGLYSKDGTLMKDGLAQQLGAGLTGIVGGIDTAIRKVIEFRSEIYEAGVVLVTAFGATKALQALNGLVNYVQVAGTQIGVLRREIGAMNEAFSLANAAFAGAGTRLEGFRAIASGVAIGLRGIMVAAIELAPLLAVVGAAVMAAASYFDLFGSKVRDARTDVEKFGGAASKASLDIFKGSIDKASAALDALKKKQDALNARPGSGNFKAFGYEGQIAAAEKALEKDRKTYADALAVYEADGAERAATTRLRALELSTQQERRALDQRGRDMADAQEKKLAALSKDRKSTTAADTEYAEAEKARQLSVLDVQINATQRAYDAAVLAAKNLKGERLIQENAFIDGAGKALDELREKRKQAASTDIKVPLTSKQVDEQKLLDKGQKALDNLKASITGLRAGLAGASVEVYELQQKLADGKFGPVDSGKVQELINQLLAAQAEKSKLDELFEGKTKFDKDLGSLELKAQEALFEAQNRNLSAYDKFVVKVNSGGYAGVGNGGTPAERAMIAQRIATVAAGDAAVQAGNQIKQSLGEGAVAALNPLHKKVVEIADAMRGVGTAANGIQMPQVAGSVTSAGMGTLGAGAAKDPVNTNLSAAARAFLNAISGPESGGRYNIRYGGVGSPGKTFDSFDAHPNVMEMRADGRRSSAAGRYQFTKSTWDSMGGGEFSPAAQDLKAWQLAVQDYKRNAGGDLEKELRENGFSDKIVQALGGTWEGLKSGAGASKSRKWWADSWERFGDSNTVQRDSTYKPMRESDPKSPIPSNIGPTEANKLEAARKAFQQAGTQQLDNALVDQVKTLTENWKEASAVADGYGKRVSALRKQIGKGELGDDKNPDAERYKEAIKAAELLDAADAEQAKNAKDRSRIGANEESRAREAEELALRAAALKRQQANQTNVDLSDSYYRKEAENMRVLEAAKRLQGNGHKDWSEDKVTALAESQKASLTALRDQEVLELQQAELKKTQAIERENMTADQARQRAYDDEARRQQALVDLTTAGSEARATAETNASRRMAAEREKLAQNSPLNKQMKEWGALSENMEKAATGWLDSAADGIAEFVTTGKADFASLFQSIAKDITKMGLKYMMSQMFGGAKGGGAGGGGLKSLFGAKTGAAAGGAGKLGGGAKMFGAMHTGGIVGSGFSLSRNVSPSVFSGAPRFHTGGVLGEDEIPIIAQRGEGVFTKAQMAAMGGAGGSMNNITLAPSITVNAAGGTPEQNADLAQQTAKAAEGMMRGLVQKELMSQLRPGNLLNQ